MVLRAYLIRSLHIVSYSQQSGPGDFTRACFVLGLAILPRFALTNVSPQADSRLLSALTHCC
jgi:hypothetical protein